MKIYGLEKLSMVDFEGHLCATVFTAGCNFRCPFCHNSNLVNLNDLTQISEEEFFTYLDKRKNLLDSVCVSGGEPCLQTGLKEFIKKIKDKGFLVKLDTNGTRYDLLKELIDQKLVDYVAMDVKNSRSLYPRTAGAIVDMNEINKSVELLKSNVVPYEFRTTLVSDFHTIQSIEEMADWLEGAEKLYLQHFKDNGTCIESGLSEVKKEKAEEFQKILSKKIKKVLLRGY